MRKYLTYLKSLLLHKWYVFVAGRYVGVSFWQLLVHDLSKFSTAEFGAYVAHSSTKEGRGSEAFAAAWLHHENANPHHWGYYLPRSGKYANQPLPMPDRYIREMIADWMGAGRAYTGRWDIADWLNENFPGFSDKLHEITMIGVILNLSRIGVQSGMDGRVFIADSKFLKWAGEEAPATAINDWPPLTTYHCPDCGRQSSEMPIIEREHEPTAEDLAARPDMAFIGHELLACPCGRLLTWFDMEERP